ncbi:hypothetical protein HDA40_002128 [Hamadaea flava]|uniref:DUF4314 domain-containing protein n=1 Tax=Hamadaea flava TaxID=1742688 RepID=A0ABV8LK95_9ACTN|nr:DUF4314 domain-containing protein [Hamadaea flava]MCP2323621.1 hypothetical protein [Hamadaea flava]
MNSQHAHEHAAHRKAEYRRGMRVRLIRFATTGDGLDDNHLVPNGTCGTITFIDDLGTLHMRWDNGSTLGLAIGDEFELLPASG